MGGIAGLWHFDGAPVYQPLLERMAAPTKHRGPDGIGYWLGAAKGMINFHFWTTPESVGETQPLVDETGNLCLTLHGRVDNRDELIAALMARDVLLRTSSDAEIILRAYQVWGEQCPQKIIGEFAVAIWDEQQQQLFCARDISGWKPFYYYHDRHQFVWASEFPPFFQVEGVPKEPNEKAVAEYLGYTMLSMPETLYRDIMCLPPAHTLVVTRQSAQIQRYWGLDSIQDVRFRTDAEYAERFLELFQDAVRSQLRVHGRLSATLSGGLDSSSVVSVAVPLLGEALQDFEVFALCFPGKAYDETGYIQDVVDKWHLNARLFGPQDYDPQAVRDFARRSMYLPPAPNGTSGAPYYQYAQKTSFASC
jgi:asparagine synthase (glutamine-hydrolysing)